MAGDLIPWLVIGTIIFAGVAWYLAKKYALIGKRTLTRPPPSETFGSLEEVEQSLPIDKNKPTKNVRRRRKPSSSSGTPKKKALIIGIDYVGQKNAVQGCVNDSALWKELLQTYFNYSNENIRVLTDYTQHKPTKKNIIQNLQWLVENASEGDQLFFHYSGHGTQVKDRDGDEQDGLDEALVPLDVEKAGVIVDDDLKKLLIDRLPPRARLTVIIDACHSGTALDAPYALSFSSNLSSFKWEETSQKKNSKGTVLMLSGCRDEQTSVSSNFLGMYGGALTTAAVNVLHQYKQEVASSKKSDDEEEPGITVAEFFTQVVDFLKKKGFVQIPQFSSTIRFDPFYSELPI